MQDLLVRSVLKLSNAKHTVVRVLYLFGPDQVKKLNQVRGKIRTAGRLFPAIYEQGSSVWAWYMGLDLAPGAGSMQSRPARLFELGTLVRR